MLRAGKLDICQCQMLHGAGHVVDRRAFSGAIAETQTVYNNIYMNFVSSFSSFLFHRASSMGENNKIFR